MDLALNDTDKKMETKAKVSTEDDPLNPRNEDQDGMQCCTNGNVCLRRVVFLLFFMADLMMVPYVGQYVLYKASRHSGVANASTETNTCLNNSWQSEGEVTEWDLVQQEAADTVFYVNAAELLPMVCSVLVLGTWSDISQRRKPLLWLPMVGDLFYSGSLLADYYIQPSANYFLYFGAFCSGISGGYITFLTGAASLISDISSEEQRTRHLTILDLCLAVSMGIINLSMGYVISYLGYPNPLWMTLLATITALTMCYFVQEPSKPTTVTLNDYVSKITKTMSIFTRSTQLSYIISMYVIALGFYNFIHVGQERTNVLFLETTPLCLNSVMIGWWLFAQGLIMAMGVFFLPRFGMECLDDTVMTCIGLLSRAAGSLCLIFADSFSSAFTGELICPQSR